MAEDRARSRSTKVAILGAVTLALAGDARANTFEQAAGRAIRVQQLDELVWVLTATCDGGDDVQDRQCRQVRDRRAKELAAAPVLVEADPRAFTAGPWNPARRSAPIRLTGCVRCDGIPVDGRTWHVTVGPPRIDGGAIRAAALHDTAKVFPDEAAAAGWLASVASVRVQLVLKVPARPRWQVAGKDGIALELVAFRVVAPCTGAVAIAAPPSGPAEADPGACAPAAR